MLEMGLSGSEGGVAANPPFLPLSSGSWVAINRDRVRMRTLTRPVVLFCAWIKDHRYNRFNTSINSRRRP